MIDNNAEIYKEFQELADGVEENLMGYTRHYQISGQTTEELKTLLISLKRMYELGKSRNMGKHIHILIRYSTNTLVNSLL